MTQQIQEPLARSSAEIYPLDDISLSNSGEKNFVSRFKFFRDLEGLEGVGRDPIATYTPLWTRQNLTYLYVGDPQNNAINTLISEFDLEEPVFHRWGLVLEYKPSQVPVSGLYTLLVSPQIHKLLSSTRVPPLHRTQILDFIIREYHHEQEGVPPLVATAKAFEYVRNLGESPFVSFIERKKRLLGGTKRYQYIDTINKKARKMLSDRQKTYIETRADPKPTLEVISLACAVKHHGDPEEETISLMEYLAAGNITHAYALAHLVDTPEANRLVRGNLRYRINQGGENEREFQILRKILKADTAGMYNIPDRALRVLVKGCYDQLSELSFKRKKVSRDEYASIFDAAAWYVGFASQALGMIEHKGISIRLKDDQRSSGDLEVDILKEIIRLHFAELITDGTSSAPYDMTEENLGTDLKRMRAAGARGEQEIYETIQFKFDPEAVQRAGYDYFVEYLGKAEDVLRDSQGAQAPYYEITTVAEILESSRQAREYFLQHDFVFADRLVRVCNAIGGITEFSDMPDKDRFAEDQLYVHEKLARILS